MKTKLEKNLILKHPCLVAIPLPQSALLPWYLPLWNCLITAEQTAGRDSEAWCLTGMNLIAMIEIQS